MRLMVLALVLLPVAAQAQSTTETTPGPQSCGAGMIWSSEAGACMAADQHITPMDSLPAGSGCSHGGAQQVTS